MLKTLGTLSLISLSLSVGPALADDWVATQLRGQVLQLADGAWLPVHRDDAVPDTHLIRTLGNGYATFTRGAETVALGPNTQVAIFDRPGVKPYTTVKQSFGTVSIEAQVEQVQHFAVDTPYLAAVVKGTRFTVISTPTGSSVSVQRGHVSVEDLHDHSHVTIALNQAAAIDTSATAGAIAVSGEGALPQVLDAKGKPLPPTPPAPKDKPTPPDPKDPPAAKGPDDPPAPPPKDPKPPKNPPPPRPPKDPAPPKPPKGP